MKRRKKTQRILFTILLLLALQVSYEFACSPIPSTEKAKESSLEPAVHSEASKEPFVQENPIKDTQLYDNKTHDKDAGSITPDKQEPIDKQEPSKQEPNSEKNAPDSISKEQKPDALQPDNPPYQPNCQLTQQAGDKYKINKGYFGFNRYIKYVAGSLPIILSAPHGGKIRAKEIKTRTYGVLGGDSYSQEYTYEVARRLYQLTGRLPHIIVNRLHRSKLDANRAIKEASQGDPKSEHAWRDFRDYILSARKWVTGHCQRGHYFDLHTNAHKNAWTELGILLSSKNLAESDQTLDNDQSLKDKSSWKHMVNQVGISFSERLRGTTSLGAMLFKRGYKSIPSPKYPNPNGGGYFNGGYNTAQYGSRHGGTIDGTQIETHLSFITDTKRFKYARALAESLLTFVEKTYNFSLRKKTTTLANSQCSHAKELVFKQAKIDLYGQTWGALAEFFGKLDCGTTIKLNGAQVYYRLKLQANKHYSFTMKADFPARMYLFGDVCSVAKINAQCKTSGISGTLFTPGIEKTITYQPKTTGWVRFAVGSRSLHWLGSFHLIIK